VETLGNPRKIALVPMHHGEMEGREFDAAVAKLLWPLVVIIIAIRGLLAGPRQCGGQPLGRHLVLFCAFLVAERSCLRQAAREIAHSVCINRCVRYFSVQLRCVTDVKFSALGTITPC